MKWIISYLLFICVSVVSATILGTALGTINQQVAFFSFACGVVSVITFLRNKNISLIHPVEKKDIGFWTIFTVICFILFSLRAFLWVIFQVSDSIRVISPNNLGDVSLHISFIRYLANGPEFWPSNHFFPGDKTRYPIGMDLFNGLLVILGMDLFKSLRWIGILCSVSAAFALLHWGRAFALAGFLFSGGLAGFLFFKTFIFSDYQAELAWKSLPLSMFVTQRGLLYALPVGLLLLSSWQKRFFPPHHKSNEDLRMTLPVWVEVIFYSSMPIFHAHTFVVFSLFLLIWFFFVNYKEKIHLVKLLLFSLPLIGFIFFLLSDINKASSLIYLKWGWMQGNQNFFKFWLLNFGVFWPLVIMLILEIPPIKGIYHLKSFDSTLKQKFMQDRIIILSSIFIFALFTIVMMAPWEWDNCKLLIWPYLVLLPYLWENLVSLWNVYARYITCFLLFFSGFICVLGGFPEKRGHEIFRYSEVSKVEKAVSNIPVEHRFASYPTYNHPLLFLGRKVVLGYPGWMWSHGYKTEKIEQKLRALMLGEENWKELAEELGVKFIYWGSREMKEYSLSKRPWEKSATKVASDSWGEVYDIFGSLNRSPNFKVEEFSGE